MTALREPAKLKWQRFVKPGTPLPTIWPKAVYEENSRAFQKRRAALRAASRPESEMSALFREDLQFTAKLFGNAKHRHDVGAFEGANYEAKGYYRSEMQCLMFDRSERFCKVCNHGVMAIIDLYSAKTADK